MPVHEAMAHAFAAEDTTQVFGVMGDANLLWLASMEDRGIPLRQARHEAGAIAMVDGHARASGGVGVGMVTSGPGLTHAATSLVVAARHGTPMVVFTGDSPRDHHELGGIQEIDQRAIAQSCDALFVPVRAATTVAEDVQRAFHLARTRSVPVVLDVPSDLTEQAADGPAYVPSSALQSETAPARPADGAAAKVLAELDASDRPVVVLGRMALDELADATCMADAAGALIAVTLDAMGRADAHPFSVGLIGPFAHPVGERLCRDADLVIAVGGGLSRFPTAVANSFPAARVIALGDDASRLGPRRFANRLLSGSTRGAIDAVLAALRGERREGYRTNEVREQLEADERLHDLAIVADPEEDGRIDPRRAMLALDDALPATAHVVIGAAHFWSWPNMFLTSSSGGRRFHHTHDFGAIGQALPTAVGVAAAGVGAGARPAIAIEGDGGFMQHVQEIDTAVRYGLPLMVVVVDDDALGAEFHKLRARGLPTETSLIPTPDCELLARAFGANGVTATTAQQIRKACVAFTADPRPTVLDIKVARGVVSRSYRRMHFGAPG